MGFFRQEHWSGLPFLLQGTFLTQGSNPHLFVSCTGRQVLTSWATGKVICCWSVAQSCLTLCDPMDCSLMGLPVPHHLPELALVTVHCIGDAVQPSHPLMPSSPSALDLSQHQGFFQWVICLHHMTKILELQLRHQSFQWIFRVDLL